MPWAWNYKTPHEFLQGGSCSLEGISPRCPPVSGRAVIFYFTSNSVSAFVFSTSEQMPSLGSKDTVESRPIPLDEWPTNGRIITIAEVFPKEWGVKPILGSLGGGAICGSQAPGMSGFEDQQGLHAGESASCRKSHTPHDSGRGGNLKGACVRPICWSWRASRKGRRSLGYSLGT